jgi:phage terminase large subunit-like protein
VDNVTVKHVSGDTSRLTFKTYDQGRERWQAATLDLVWFDEEPPAEIYSEGLTRTNATGGMAFMTFTPLLGMSDVVRRFLNENSPDRNDTNMTIDDAEHIAPEERRRIIESYPAHEREARTKGTPILGSGRIFPIEESLVAVDPFQMPSYWPQLGAMDFGWDHPFAAVKGTFDPDTDTIYITNAYRARQETPILHAAALKPWGKWVPWAWPHDGLQHDKGSGEQLAKQYEGHGLNMMENRATFEDGSNGVEAGLMDMLDRMQTGRLKVFRHLNEWFEEFRLYHRKDGKVVKEADDLMAATRYLVMSIRHALLSPELRSENRRKREGQQSGDPLAGF